MTAYTRTLNWLRSSGVLPVVLLVMTGFILCTGISARAVDFKDVAADHWAAEAIRKLVEKGYMDGFADETFRGRKVISRYELAITLAKLLDRMHDIETSGGVISREDAERVKKLAGEFKGELEDLGVRLEGLETRLGDLEKWRKERDVFTVGGYYRASQFLVWDRLSTINDPQNWPLDEVDATDQNGLTNLEQELHVKVTGRPSDQIEAYMELLGYLNQDYDAYWRYWQYQEAWMKPTSVVRPWLDNRTVDQQRDKDVYMDKAHLTFKSEYATVRAFADERFEKFDDPVNLLNGSGRNLRYSNCPRVFQGVETIGTVKDLNYQLTFLRERLSNQGTSYYIDDDTGFEDYFLKYRVNDIYGARAVYRVPERILGTKTAEVAIGTSFVERAKNYTNVGDFEQANAVDLFFKFTDVGTLKTSAEYIDSRSGLDADKRVKRDQGFKIDSEFNLEPLTFIVNHYKYGPDFFVGTARWDSLLIDVDDERTPWNYGRKGRDGEKLTRMTLKYDQRFGEEQGIKTEGVAQTKKWEVPETHQVYDLTAQLYSFQLWADMSRYVNGRIFTELKKDALKEEIGKTWTEIEFNGKFPEVQNLAGQFKFGTSADRDSIDKSGGLERYNSWYGEISADLAPMVWSKVSAQREIDKIGWHDGNVTDPSTDNTEKITDTVGFETNVNFGHDFTVKFDYHTAHDVWANFPNENTRKKWFVTELSKIFTDKLKFKGRYWWKDYNRWSNRWTGDDFYWGNDKLLDLPDNSNNLRNWTLELTYEPMKSSKLRVLWGDWIDYKQDEKDIETERRLLFEMKTEF